MKYVKGINYNNIAALEARVKAIEGANLYNLSQAIKICVVLNVSAPKNFHVLEFIKYTGTQCPATHLKSYCNKMTKVVHDEKLLMHFFQESLNRVALSWHMSLYNLVFKVERSTYL
jgi:hypothetical protein